MDLPGLGDFEGKTLADLCEDETNVDAKVWKDFYDSFETPHTPSPGVLPLRIWQLYREMVSAAATNDPDLFILAAGTLAHYAGDSSQPQHGTRLDHGDAPLGRETPKFKAYAKTPQYKIHGIYEELVFQVRPTEMLDKINTATETLRAKQSKATHGTVSEAALATIATMKTVRGILSPEKIMEKDDPSLPDKQRAELFFKAFANKTAACIAEGAAASGQPLADRMDRRKGRNQNEGAEYRGPQS